MNYIKQNSEQTIRIDTELDLSEVDDIRFNFFQQGRLVVSRRLSECAAEGSEVIIELTAADTCKFSPNRAVIEPVVYPKDSQSYTAPSMIFTVEPSEIQQEG